MAKKTTTSKAASAPKAASKAVAAPTTTAVRNSAVPPKVAAKKLAPTYDQIALSAYLIWKSGQGDNQEDNWFRAERELRGV